MQNNRYFSNIAYQSIQRALSLMDRSSYSKTFGCFDRYYWHFKMKDFPSASYQMGVEFLARLWADSHKDNSFYKQECLLDWIKASFEYSCFIQNKDGSFDEWYPNERGWAGPTSYIISSLANAYKLTEKEWDEGLKNKFKKCLDKAFQFLVKQKEGAYLANHTALFLLSLYEIFQIIGSAEIEDQFKSFLQDFKKLICEEGWSKEYDGADFGYNMATLSFLARLYNLYPEPFFKDYAEKSLSFLSCFFYPDGSFGGLGSRETVHLYPYALKFWGGAEKLSIAQDIYSHLIHNKSFENLRPFDQDDHYLFYRLNEYLSADEIVLDPSCFPAVEKKLEKNNDSRWNPQNDSNKPDEKNSCPRKSGNLQEKPQRSNSTDLNNNFKNSVLPCLKQDSFEKHFSQAGFFLKKTNFFYLAVNLKRGGAFRLYSLNKPCKSLKNKGWVLKTKANRLMTNFWHSEKSTFAPSHLNFYNSIKYGKKPSGKTSKIEPNITISDNQVTIEGQAFFIHQRYFNRLKFILFRIFTFFAFNYKSAFLIKKLIRSLLILKSQKAKCFFKRVIRFDKEEVSIEDTIESETAGSVFYGGEFVVRYVPQSNYFEKADLYNRSSVFKIDNKLIICQNYNFRANTVKTFEKESK